VRREVLGLAIAEAHLFPTGWGFDAPPTSDPRFGPELERAGSLSKQAMIGEIDVSVATAMADMHEHLGQLIAYARSNHGVPPWSAGNE
jgi:hypothetical protein